MNGDTERIRTHLTPVMLRIGHYERTGDLEDIQAIEAALGRALSAASAERARLSATLCGTRADGMEQ